MSNYEPDFFRDLAEIIWGAVEYGDPGRAERRLREALAEAWELGRRTEARMWAETADLSTPDEDREQGRNPFKENS